MYIPSTKWTWSFMIASLVQLAIALSLEAYVILSMLLFAANPTTNTPVDMSSAHSKQVCYQTYPSNNTKRRAPSPHTSPSSCLASSTKLFLYTTPCDSRTQFKSSGSSCTISAFSSMLPFNSIRSRRPWPHSINLHLSYLISGRKSSPC
jgi:hypothetical protein